MRPAANHFWLPLTQSVFTGIETATLTLDHFFTCNTAFLLVLPMEFQ